MKKLLLSCAILLLSLVASAHNLRYELPVLRPWTNTATGAEINASFLVEKENEVLVQDECGAVHHLPKQEMSAQDLTWLQSRRAWTHTINNVRRVQAEKEETNTSLLPLLLFTVVLGIFTHRWMRRAESKRVLWPSLLLLSGVGLYGFTHWKSPSVEMETDPATIDAAFQPFVPAVHTYFNDTYFYLESRGIPTTHEMMVGISNHGWQQQVPIPQCYIGNNAWPIPLNPVLAENPIPVDETHFTRGAIAIAVNGVPIFNVHTNTGVDSYIDGQLDNYGGHCGRADDYHYHIAPLHLYDYTNTSLPIAYGLDGFAVYGALEPDGSPMQPLDDNHGHIGSDGVYHYHGTAEAPYMIARMAGEVTEDSTHQLIPQAAAHPVRPSLTPLNGALINLCIPNAAGNGYTLGYTLNGQQDSIVYSWTADGHYTFNFFTTGDGVPVTQEYNGFDPCVVPVNMQEVTSAPPGFGVFPNPCSNALHISGSFSMTTRWALYDSGGRCIRQWKPSDVVNGWLDVHTLPTGTYYLECSDEMHSAVQKIVKQ